MNLTASPTVAIPSAASSGISISNASSSAMTSSTVSRESAPKSFCKFESDFTSANSTLSYSETIVQTFLRISSCDIVYGI